MCSARERFCAVLSSGPLLRGDAIVVLSGDGTVRLDAGLQLFRQGGAPLVVVSGGVDNPPHSLSAQDSRRYLIEQGLAPDRIRMEGESQHTRESAEMVVEMAEDYDWKRILLVTSPYHMPRAFLTFSQVLDESSPYWLHVCPVPAAQAKWWEAPEGMTLERRELLVGEFGKIDDYQETGDVAYYPVGLCHLEHWEGKA